MVVMVGGERCVKYLLNTGKYQTVNNTTFLIMRGKFCTHHWGVQFCSTDINAELHVSVQNGSCKIKTCNSANPILMIKIEAELSS